MENPIVPQQIAEKYPQRFSTDFVVKIINDIITKFYASGKSGKIPITSSVILSYEIGGVSVNNKLRKIDLTFDDDKLFNIIRNALVKFIDVGWTVSPLLTDKDELWIEFPEEKPDYLHIRWMAK